MDNCYSGFSYWKDFTTATLTASRVYYVSTYNTSLNCISEGRSPVTVTVNPIIAPGGVMQESIRIEGITQDNQIYTLPTDQKTTQIAYLDGLQRVNQKVIVKASP